MDLTKPKSGVHIFFPTCLESCGVDVPVVQLAAHAKSSTLYTWLSYGHKSKFFWLDGLRVL